MTLVRERKKERKRGNVYKVERDNQKELREKERMKM